MTALDRPAAAPLSLVLGRSAALLALASATVHLLLFDATSTGSLAMAGMAMACLPCAWHLWRAPTPGVWGMTAAVDAGMALVHSQMLSGAMAGMPSMRPADVGMMWLGLGLVGAQLALAAVATAHRYRHRDERS